MSLVTPALRSPRSLVRTLHLHHPQLELDPKADVRLRTPAPMSSGVLRRALAIAETLFADGERDGEPHEVFHSRIAWLGSELAAFSGRAGSWARLVTTICVCFTYTFAPFFIKKPFAGFVSLSDTERTQALLALEHSAFAPAFLATKAMLCVVYYEAPGVAQELGASSQCAAPSESPAVAS